MLKCRTTPHFIEKMNNQLIFCRIPLTIIALLISACTQNPLTSQYVINTDSIAGYWSGVATSQSEDGEQLPPIDIGILLIADCRTGELCGKYTENNQCPGDIILQRIEGKKFHFLAQTQTGRPHSCSATNTISFELSFRPDGTLAYTNHSRTIRSGVLYKAEADS